MNLQNSKLKNFTPLPNEIFSLHLSTGELATYAVLMRLEDPRTYECWPSYETIGKAMNECTYKNYDELPLMLKVVQVAAVLGISRAGAYELVHSEGFPTLKIGSRIVVPKDKLREWIDANTAQK